MPAARCYECSTCGRIVRETARTCSFCGSDIATVRCGRCFMMNVTEAVHCIGCGAELGLMPVSQDVLANACCPRCQDQKLDAFSNDGGTVYDCGRCGGQFVANDVLGIMIARHQACVFDLPKRLRRNNPLTDRVTYLPCPFCKDLMIRRNFGKASGIIVDVCGHHGTWFDMGELPRILAFVGSGGMQRAQSIDETHKKWVSQQMQTISSGPRGTAFGFFEKSTSSAISFTEMEEATVAFVRWVREMLR